MSIEYADVAETVFYNEDSSQPMTVLKPSAFGTDQLLLFCISDDTGALSDLTAPAGWTLVISDSTPGEYFKAWYHVYDGSEPGSWSFGYNVGAACSAVLFRIIDADTTPTIVSASAVDNSSDATMDSPTVTPSSANDLLLSVYNNSCGGNNLGYTVPAGMYDLGKTQASATFQGLAAAREYLADPSATGVRTWTGISFTGKQAVVASIAVKSSGLFDPDPPLRPPAPEVPPWLMHELVMSKQRPLKGDAGAPLVKEQLSGGSSGSNVTLNTAATTDVGDLLVVFHGNNFYTAAQMLTPTGTAGTWTQQALGDNGTNSVHMKIWTRPVTVGGAQTVTLAPAIDEEHTVQLFVVSGCDAVSPVDNAAGGNGATSTSQVAPSTTPASLNDLLLCGDQSGGQGTFTAPSGMDARLTVNVPGFITAVTASQVLGTGGATGTRTFTTTLTDPFATASITLTSLAPAAAGTNAPAELADSAAAALDASTAITVNAEASAATATASDPTAAVSPLPAEAAVSALALDATTAVTVNAECASATATAGDPTAAVAPQPTQAAATATANDATTAQSASAEVATATATGQDPTPAVSAFAECATAAATANDATVSTATGTSAPAECATATGTAQDPTVALGVQPAEAAATATANNPTTALTVNAEAAPATATAQDPTPAISVFAECATASALALDATVSTSSSVSAFAECATASAAANDPTASVAAQAALASAAAVVDNALASLSALAGAAAGSATANDPTTALAVLAEVALAGAAALDVATILPAPGSLTPATVGPALAASTSAGSSSTASAAASLSASTAGARLTSTSTGGDG